MSLNIREDDLRREGLQLGEKIGFERGVAAGIRRGRRDGILQGRRDGIAAGSYQKARETAKLMQRENCPTDFIQRMTGLTESEIEGLN